MKVKSVSFEEYTSATIGNEGKRYGEIINIAWKNTDEAKHRRKSLERIASSLVHAYVLCKAPMVAACIAAVLG